MNICSEVEFPPLQPCFKSPMNIKSSNANNTPSEVLNSSLNPSAEVFTPRSYKRNNASSGKKSSGKRRLSMTSILNTSVSSIDTSISDTIENENDPEVLARREKNIRYGKNTEAYERYVQVLPKEHRVKNSPRTPIKEMRYSRRQWDGLIKHWKLKIHSWDRDANGVECNPSFSTPKRQKTKCDRRSVGYNIISPVRTIGDMLPPSIKLMLSSDEKKVQDYEQDEDTEVIDWSKPSEVPRIMDWSKECVSSGDEGDRDVSNEKTDSAVEPFKIDVNAESASTDLPTEPSNIPSATESSKPLEDEEMVYKCVSLVEAIAAFDDETYNEEEDEDYVPPEERGLKLEEIGLDASSDDSDSDPETLFYQIVQRNEPYRSR